MFRLKAEAVQGAFPQLHIYWERKLLFYFYLTLTHQNLTNHYAKQCGSLCIHMQGLPIESAGQTYL